jgi:hypothetical protein
VKALVVPHSPHRVTDMREVFNIAYEDARKILKNKDANIVILEMFNSERYGWVVLFAEVGYNECPR